MAVQGHPRLLISVPIERVCATSKYSSIVTLVISCPSVSEILQVFGFPEFWYVLLELYHRWWVPTSEDPKLIICAITFEVTQSMVIN